jgi:hypothetical protein
MLRYSIQYILSNLTEDHKPDNMEEKEVIEKNGGYEIKYDKSIILNH